MSSTKPIRAFRGIRSRLTLVYASLFGIFISVLTIIFTRQNIQAQRNVFDSALFNYAIDISVLVQGQDILPLELQIPKRDFEKEIPVTLHRTHVIMKTIEGEIIFRDQGGENLNVPYSASLAQKPDYTHRFLTVTQEGKEYRAVNMKVTTKGHRSIILQVATPTDKLRAEERRTIIVNVMMILLLILIASAASYVIAGRALTPVRELIGTANTIAAKNLSQRVPEYDTGDEISELSRTFNTLLGRLEKSFKAQENFVANASHQLNTPLAIIKGELDVLESKERSLTDHERFRLSLREELERLIALVEKMLLISRVEAGHENFIFQPVRLDEILLNTSARLSARAREKKITLRFNMSESLDENTLMINGERELLGALFENLLDNSIKYSPAESTVSISTLDEAQDLRVEIRDEGPGISPMELKFILANRFQRGSKIPGTGIGLSIAYEIAEYHQARIEYETSLPQGSIFRVVFPRLSKF